MTLQEKINKLNESGIYDFYIQDDISWSSINDLTKDDLQEDESNFSLIQVEILLNDSHGIYIPQKFYQNFDMALWNIKESDYTDLNDANSETYWDSWEEILNNAYYVLNGKKWHLLQDGDLYAIHYL